MNALTEGLMAMAAEKEIDLIGVTDAGEVLCRPWRHDDDPAHYSPCRATRVRPDVYDPRRVLDTARAVVMVGMYMYGFDRLEPSAPGCPRGNIGPWTRGYVEAGRYATDQVERYLNGRGYETRFSNELPYRTLAVRAGLGNIGNNGFLYHEGMGCYIRLGCVVTDAPLSCAPRVTEPGNDCGSCRLCASACPTGACDGSGELAADQCLHLWLQGQGRWGEVIPREERPKCLNYLMRTGRCLAACRRNLRLTPRARFPFQVEDRPDAPELIPLVLADADEMRRRLPWHVVKYGVEHIRRNAVIALGNARDPAAIPALVQGLARLEGEPRAMCAWALGELGQAEPLRAAAAGTPDPRTREEIEAALAKLE